MEYLRERFETISEIVTAHVEEGDGTAHLSANSVSCLLSLTNLGDDTPIKENWCGMFTPKTKKIRTMDDGFQWEIISEERAIEEFESEESEVFILHSDGTESAIDRSPNSLMLNQSQEYAIEIGHTRIDLFNVDEADDNERTLMRELLEHGVAILDVGGTITPIRNMSYYYDILHDSHIVDTPSLHLLTSTYLQHKYDEALRILGDADEGIRDSLSGAFKSPKVEDLPRLTKIIADVTEAI